MSKIINIFTQPGQIRKAPVNYLNLLCKLNTRNVEYNVDLNVILILW